MNRDLKGAHGHMAGDNLSYAGENYPSNTDPVNNTVSSAKNLYGTKDVVWYWLANHTGYDFCVNPNTAVIWVGLFHNDQFSSHDVTVDNGACAA